MISFIKNRNNNMSIGEWILIKNKLMRECPFVGRIYDFSGEFKNFKYSLETQKNYVLHVGYNGIFRAEADGIFASLLNIEDVIEFFQTYKYGNIDG